MGTRVEGRESSGAKSRVCGSDRRDRQAGATDVAGAGSNTLPSGVELTVKLAEIVIIEERALIRECLGRSFKALFQNPIATFASVEAWQAAQTRHNAGVIILGVHGSLVAPQIQAWLSKLSHAAPMVLMTDTERPEEIVAALGNGARGCISTGTCLEVAAHAIRLIMAGGTFVPASSLIAASRSSTQSRPVCDDMFTPRQHSIIEELCRGKANKVIAHDLNMCESTVKVHVRNIMKKLKATSRTEVAYFMANGLNAQRAAETLGKRSAK